jgi:pyrimidine-nucleoside phosphorylase
VRIYDIIEKKSDKGVLSKEEIDFFVNGYADGTIPDYQAAALLMAIYINGMNARETTDLTLAMMHSGDIIDLSGIKGTKVDKHSTGGVGDKTSIALGPLIAACGVPVAKISGRGLGHTGGTLDKLEAFKGFNFELTKNQFTDAVNSLGIAIAGQTSNLVPADKKIYALRDVTATVSNISLISASIMSKKLASGADAIVLDVKCGDGGFMKDLSHAQELAKAMVNIGNMVGKKTIAVISNMDQPLGFAIGNSLEVIEAIETLKGKGSAELLELCVSLGSKMILLGGKAKTSQEAEALIMNSIKSGKAIEKLEEFVRNQGGDVACIHEYSKFPKAAFTKDVKAEKSGFVSALKAEDVGICSLLLGAGRETKESKIDLSAGLILHKKMGDFVQKGDVLATLHYNENAKQKLNQAEELLHNAYAFSESKITLPNLILDVIE